VKSLWVKSIWVKNMCKKGFWVKSLWVKNVGEHRDTVDGMLAFVPPFSGISLSNFFLIVSVSKSSVSKKLGFPISSKITFIYESV